MRDDKIQSQPLTHVIGKRPPTTTIDHGEVRDAPIWTGGLLGPKPTSDPLDAPYKPGDYHGYYQLDPPPNPKPPSTDIPLKPETGEGEGGKDGKDGKDDGPLTLEDDRQKDLDMVKLFDGITKVFSDTSDPIERMEKVYDIAARNWGVHAQKQEKARATQRAAREELEAAQNDEITKSENRLREVNEKLKIGKQNIMRNEKEVNDALKRGVNPDQYFENRSNFNTLIGAIAIGMGAYGSAMTGSPNFALDIIKDAIDRDVEAQIQNLKFKKEGHEMMQTNRAQNAAEAEASVNMAYRARANRLAVATAIMSAKVEEARAERADNEFIQSGMQNLNMSKMKNEMGHMSEMDKLDLQKKQLEIQKIRQQMAHASAAEAEKQRTRTVGPALLAGIPLLENTGGLYLSGGPKVKGELRTVVDEAREGFKRSSNLNKSIDQFKALEKHTKYIATITGGTRALFGRARKDWARLHNDMKRNAKFMVQPVRQLVFGKDPRLSEPDMRIIESIANSKSV